MNSVAPAFVEASPVAAADGSVAVVITTYNHAHYLADAITSVLQQTRQVDEIIVIDDGSTDDPAAVVRRFFGVRLIRQPNCGLSAARNTGLAASHSRYIAFLDADDLLLPRAIELGVQAHRRLPGAAMVYGGHHLGDAVGKPTGPNRFDPVGASPFRELLRGNLVAMHGAALFDRQILLELGGYDTGLKRCEDYDVYLRLAHSHPVGSYPEPVAVYRMHGENMSRDRLRMLRGTLQVLDRHATGLVGADASAARAGRSIWRNYYADEALRDARASFMRGRPGAALASVVAGVRASPLSVVRRGKTVLLAGARRMLPTPLDAMVRRAGGDWIPVGRWRMGDVGRGRPASQDFGWDRGQPVDRYYVEGFLYTHRNDIAGRVLEVGDDAYSRRFGGSNVTRQDILHVHPGNPLATIVGDLTDSGVLPADTFDCIVLTQTLHLVYDLSAAVRNLYRALKPGGVALVTVPGISQIDRGEWGANWYWSIMPAAATRLFGDVFGPANVTVDAKGNVYAASGFLAGLSQGEIDLRKLEPLDPAYPVVVTVRARKHAA